MVPVKHLKEQDVDVLVVGGMGKNGAALRVAELYDPATGVFARSADKVTPRTKAIYLVHLGGLMADMDPIMELAKEHDLVVIEDNAEAYGGEYKGKKTGSLGLWIRTHHLLILFLQ